MNKLKKDLDIKIIIMLSVIQVIVFFLFYYLNFSFLRFLYIILIIPYLFMFPGYILTILFFPEKSYLNTVERIFLSFCVSIILVIPSIGLLLNYLACVKSAIVVLLIFMFILLSSLVIVYGKNFSNNFFKYSRYFNDSSICTISWKLVPIFILITIIGMLTRSLPVINYSSLVGGWFPGNSLYHTIFTLENGRIIHRWEISTPTDYSTTIYNAIHLRGMILLQSIIFLLMDITDLDYILAVNKYISWPGALLFPISAILVMCTVEKIIRLKYSNFRFSELEYILVYIFASFISFKFLYATRFMCIQAAYGYSLILLSIYAMLLSKLSKSIASKMLCILFSFSLPLFYNTAALIFLFFILVIYIAQSIKGEKIIPTNYLLAYTVFYAAYTIYSAEALYSSYIGTIKRMIDFIRYQCELEYLAEHTTPLFDISLWYILIYINTLLNIVILIVFVYYKLSKKINNYLSNFTFYLLLGLIIIFALFFSWRGLKGAIGRTEEYMSIVVIPTLLILLTELKGKKKILLYILTILIVLTSASAYVLNNTLHSEYLTYQESAAIIWYVNYGPMGNFVFTDFRLGTAPVLYNYFNFKGVLGHSAEDARDVSNIYYKKDPLLCYKILSKKFRVSYWLLSAEQMTYGLESLRDKFKPFSQDLIVVVDNSTYFSKIYDNGGAWYYMLSG